MLKVMELYYKLQASEAGIFNALNVARLLLELSKKYNIPEAELLILPDYLCTIVASPQQMEEYELEPEDMQIPWNIVISYSDELLILESGDNQLELPPEMLEDV